MKAISELSVDTQILSERLRKLSYGETVTYDELTKLIGRDVYTKARHSLASARRIALREGIVTEGVIKVGVKRLADAEVVSSVGPAARERSRRAYRRALQKLGSVQFDSLTTEQKVKHNTEVSHLGALRAWAGDKMTRKLEPKVSGDARGPLALTHTLKVFSD